MDVLVPLGGILPWQHFSWHQRDWLSTSSVCSKLEIHVMMKGCLHHVLSIPSCWVFFSVYRHKISSAIPSHSYAGGRGGQHGMYVQPAALTLHTHLYTDDSISTAVWGPVSLHVRYREPGWNPWPSLTGWLGDTKLSHPVTQFSVLTCQCRLNTH